LGEPVLLTHTASDGYRWKYRRYDPPAEARARVVCVHGIQSHGGWYDHSCRRLADAGFEVFFLDRRGSGLNEQDRGDAPSFRRLIDDIAEFLSELKTQNSKLKTFLVAISWGGKLAAALLRRHPGLVDGLALLCPGFRAVVRPPLRERLGILWSYLTAPRKMFPVPLDDPELFTASPEWQQFLRDDPLAVRRATARFLANSVRLDGYLRFVPKYVTVPVLLLLGGRDRIIDNAATRRFVESFATTDRTVIEYPEAHHTLEFEPRPHRYLDDLIGWLEQHTTNATPQAARDGPR
jgi:alpha-beta hydrolase superfamily lysophospholipase